ncbi:MAG: hypothetical protein Q9216_005202 [Gyalolechia sp. 2 TL-2023]
MSLGTVRCKNSVDIRSTAAGSFGGFPVSDERDFVSSRTDVALAAITPSRPPIGLIHMRHTVHAGQPRCCHPPSRFGFVRRWFDPCDEERMHATIPCLWYPVGAPWIANREPDASTATPTTLSLGLGPFDFADGAGELFFGEPAEGH